MEGNMQKYLNNEVIGNVRIGTRGEKDNPVKLAYFDVHTDNSTPELAVEIFTEKYTQPSSLIIKFINQKPMDVGFQRYEGKKLKCYGNSKEARQMDDKGILFLTFTGGEIFTRKDFIDIYLYAKKRGFMIELFTNGSLITDEIVKVLKKYPPILVDVSIYGASETTYQKITECHNMFDRVIENCKKMINNNIRVALRTPVLTYTLNEIEFNEKNRIN